MSKPKPQLSFTQRIKARRPLVMQLLFVTLAFALMVVSSGIFVSNMLMSYSSREAKNILTQTRFRLASELRQPETLMLAIAEEVRHILVNNGGRDDVLAFYERVSAALSDRTEGFVFAGIQSYYDKFGGEYIPFPAWDAPDGYDATARPWYVAAVEAAGEITVSPLYLSTHTGEYQVTYVCRIFDDYGEPLGVIGLNIPLFNIAKFVVGTRIAESGYGFLADENLHVIAHPEKDFTLIPMSEISPGFKEIAAALDRGEDIFRYASVNYKGMQSIFYCIQIDNGWYLGVVTPRSEYYRDFANLLIFISALGIVLMAAVCVILIRIDAAKQRADAEMKSVLAESERLRQAESAANESKSAYLEKMQDALIETEQLRKEAEAANKSKSAFLANMSHEIRTPMNAILGITEIQLQNEGSKVQREEALVKIYDSGNMLLNIINDILDLSKIEAGKLEVVPVRYDMPSLINDTVQLNILRYDSKPIKFSLDIDENTPLNLFGDELRLKQILNNILSNAFKYTDQGEVRLSVWAESSPLTGANGFADGQEAERMPELAGDGGARDDDVTLVFRVCDTGQGMTAEQLNSLFDEYTRFNMEANRTTVGAGLGMSIAKRLVVLMGGDISVESEPGKGSVFTVRLPQKRVDSLVCGSEMAEKLRNFRYRSMSMSKRSRILREYMPYGSVLIVDDVESNSYVAKGMMLPYSLNIDTASSGYEAIEKVKSGKVYDIIFMDHMMPKMDGAEATKIIRDLGYPHSIVALTANALVGQAEIFMKNGFDGYLSKPIDSRELNAVLNSFIRDRKPAEVVEAAQREQATRKIMGSTKSRNMESVLLELFLLDAKVSVKVLDEAYANLSREADAPGETDLTSYEITVHGMKGALGNIGETELSDFAYRLEQAAKNKDLAVITGETPEFIGALKALIEKHRPDDEISEADMAYLQDKLLAVKELCEASNKAGARAAMSVLMNKTWTERIDEILDEISVHLLHDEFKEAAAAIETAADIFNELINGE